MSEQDLQYGDVSEVWVWCWWLFLQREAVSWLGVVFFLGRRRCRISTGCCACASAPSSTATGRARFLLSCQNSTSAWLWTATVHSRTTSALSTAWRNFQVRGWAQLPDSGLIKSKAVCILMVKWWLASSFLCLFLVVMCCPSALCVGHVVSCGHCAQVGIPCLVWSCHRAVCSENHWQLWIVFPRRYQEWAGVLYVVIASVISTTAF